MSDDLSGKKMNAFVKDAQHYKRLVTAVQTLNEQKSFCDLCFVCARGHKIYAHKLLFCTVSNWLKEIFLEVQDYLQTIFVHLPDVEPHMVERLLDFLYEGSVKVNNNEYKDFQSTMDMLGIDLTSPKSKPANKVNRPAAGISQPVLQVQQLAVPQQQYLYMPTTPNAQGQVQYVLATPTQMNQQGQVVQGGSLMSPVVSQGQMVQNGAQVMNSQVQPGNVIQMVQQNNTQVQNGGQVMSSPVQQGNMMQMVQQNNTQVVPMNQLISGGQMLQCSSQMVMQGNQQNLLSSNQLQVGMQPQVAQSNYATNQPMQQQQPQYVMASNSNQLVTTRTTTQYHQPRTQGMTRARTSVPSTQMQQNSRMISVTPTAQLSRDREHLPVKGDKGPSGERLKKKCRMCKSLGKRTETYYYCRLCPDKPSLCLDPCFQAFHKTRGT